MLVLVRTMTVLALLASAFLAAAQKAVITTPQWGKLKVARPYDPIQIHFIVPRAFVGESFTVDAKFAENGWDVNALTLIRRNSTYVGMAGPTPVAGMAGIHELVWTAVGSNTTLTAKFEVSCTDGDKCNGYERLVFKGNGKPLECVRPKRALCDDGVACTEDKCEDGICSHTIRTSALTRRDCPSCQGKQCRPNCRRKECGGDGCGGTCGSPCEGDGIYCIEGKCLARAVNGTCKTPFDLTAEATASNWRGMLSVEGDTSKGIHQLIPQCNPSSDAGEQIYMLRTPPTMGFVGIDARVHTTKKRPDGSYAVDKLDTVLQLIEVDPAKDADLSKACMRSNVDATLTVACADDSSPPGSLSSRVTWMLKPSHVYFIHVDGYSAPDVGPFLLTVRLTPQCTMQCQGKFCGPSGCPGFDCGNCASNTQCSADGLACVAPDCRPKCKRGPKRCGSDGCGGSCGTCDNSQNEFCLDGLCKKFPECDSLLPRCFHNVRGRNGGLRRVSGCPVNRFCASDCKCRSPDELMPDLALAAEVVVPEIVDNYLIESTSCALAEGCVKGIGMRRIIKFSTDIFNQGDAMFNPPNPPESRPDLYEWAQCHGHFHFQSFAKFELLNLNNETIVEGQKRSYCAVDSHKRFPAHPKMPCTAQTTCSTQGISLGWMDTYGPNLDCQFIDLEGVPAGHYRIKQCANFDSKFPEKSPENNCIVNNVYIPPRAG